MAVDGATASWQGIQGKARHTQMCSVLSSARAWQPFVTRLAINLIRTKHQQVPPSRSPV